MRVSSFRFLTSGQRGYLREAFSTVVESWRSEWFGPRTPVSATTLFTDFDPVTKSTLRVYRGDDGAWIGIGLARWAEFPLIAGLFDIAPDEDFNMGPVASAVVEAALRDLAGVAMQSAIRRENTCPGSSIRAALPGDAFRRGSSRIGITFMLGAIPVTVFAGSAVVEKQLEATKRSGAGRPVEGVHRALGLRLVPAQVQLGNADILVDDLLSLRVGDVVRINQRLDQPLDVSIEGEKRLNGFLARTVDGRKCVRLVAVK